ncbi:hypothetical protein D3C81_1836770 [compost metagenome]
MGRFGRQVALGLFDGLRAGVHAGDQAAFTCQQQGHDALRAADIQDPPPFDRGADPMDAGLRFPHELIPQLAVIGFHHAVMNIGQR